MFHERFEELKHTGKLPTPSGVGLKILFLTQNDDVDMDELVSLIQVDPALTSRIIKLAASAQLASAVPVTSVKEAAIRIGLRTLCNVSLGFTIVSGNRAGKCEGFDYESYWAFSLANAVAAQKISSELEIGDPTEAFTCALLMRIGRLALASVHPTEYSLVLSRLAGDPTLKLAEIERAHFCMDHRQVASALFEDWGLPKSFGDAALFQDGREIPDFLHDEQTRDFLRILNCSSVMAETCISDQERQPHLWPTLKQLCSDLGIEALDMCRVFDQVALEWEEWGASLALPTRQVIPSEKIEEQADAMSDAPQTESQGPGSGLRVLAVDDDPVSLRLLVSLLKKAGHTVLTATNGKEALAVALEKGPQMVVTDWMMPEMDGLELCKQLRRMEAGQNLYILILTGRAEEDRIVEAFEAGADDYIVKPFNPKLLRARIRPGVRVIQLQEQNDRHLKTKEELNARLSIEKRKLKAAAMTDALTELPNRRYAMKRLEKEWANSLRSNLPLSVIMLDIDHFKMINDTHGHDVGDAVLQSTAKAIQRVLRRGDTCARIGGEEFLVVCPNTGPKGTLRVAERIRQSIEENMIQMDGSPSNVTASLGVGIRTPEAGTIDALLKMADEAVYEAKRGGRNRVLMGRPPMRDAG